MSASAAGRRHDPAGSYAPKLDEIAAYEADHR
jgi:hypothetical protein